jgi:hypothetical protein
LLKSECAVMEGGMPLGSRWIGVLALCLPACVPDLANQCGDDSECPVERPVCLAGVCTPPRFETAEADATPFEWPDGAADAEPDAFDWTAAADAGPDAFDWTADTDAPGASGGQSTAADEAADAAPACEETRETCNDADDDCDGRVDERPADCGHGHDHHHGKKDD